MTHKEKIREMGKRRQLEILCRHIYGPKSDQAKKALRKYEECNQERWWRK